MFDFRRFEHVFLCSLIVVAVFVGAARLVVQLSQPEVQLTLAARSAEAYRTPSDTVEGDFEGPKGSILTALTPLPISRFGMLPYYVGAGWERIVNGTSTSERSQTDSSSRAPESQPEQGSPRSTSGIMPDGRVDINRATAEELQTLPGIGPAIAARIIEVREYRGGFVYPEELLDVSGIGPARYERLMDHIIIGPLEE